MLMLRFVDAIIIIASLFLVSLLSPYSGLAAPWFERYFVAGLLAVALFFLFADHFKLYQKTFWKREGDHQLLKVWAGVIIGLLIFAFLFKTSASYPRRVIIVWFAFCPLLLFSLRSALFRLRKVFHSVESTRIALVGSQRMFRTYRREIERQSDFRGVAWFDVESDGREKILSDLIAEAEAGAFDAIFILPNTDMQISQRLMIQLREVPIGMYFVPDQSALRIVSGRLFYLGAVPVVSVSDPPLGGFSTVVKRIEDLVLASVFLLFAIVPMIVISIAILVTDGRPVFFRQKRHGLDGKTFYVLKFRTLDVCESGAEARQVESDDPRLTPLGRWLRRFSLDELPQLFNVLSGSMSIVGPRPHPTNLDEVHQSHISGYRLRMQMKPGITGLAQVNGFRGPTQNPEKMAQRLAYDLEYIRHWSLWLDFKIVLFTLMGGFFHKNAI